MKEQIKEISLILSFFILIAAANLTILTNKSFKKNINMDLKKNDIQKNTEEPKANHIGNRILEIQQGFNEKYDTQNFLHQLDGQLTQLDQIDKGIKGFKDWVIKETDKILYHMEHNTDLTTPDTLMRVMYAKKMIEVSQIFFFNLNESFSKIIKSFFRNTICV